MEETTLVHLSDTHLGHDYVMRSLLCKRLFWKTEDEKLLRNLEAALRQIKPDYIIHTGDVVNKATPRNFTKAAGRLRNLFGNAGIDIKRRVFVIPGNHDVKILPREDKFWGRLEGFNSFLKWFFDEADYRSRKPNFVTVDVERKIWFFCLDSTLKEQYQFAEGEVGPGQWEWLNNKFDSLMKLHPNHEQFVKIVAIHHHPHPIKAGGQERFMQLLDAGKAIDLFEKFCVNIVLHGHKHFPHVMLHPYGTGGGQHYTVVGAGTVTCPFLEEQSGEGNSFNVLKLRAASNVLSIQRWKANNDKEFVPVFPEPILHPLFPVSGSGYRVAQSRMICQILDTSGLCLMTQQRLGLLVDGKDVELKNLAFGMGGSAAQAELAEFEYDEENISSVYYKIKERAQRRGHFVLREPLRQGAEPLDLWFTYELKAGFCMRRSEFHNFYPGSDSYEESVEVEMIHPCDQLTVVIEFPRKYDVNPCPMAVDQNGVEIRPGAPRFSFQPDKLANRFSLVVRKPQLQYRYGIHWQVPDMK